MNLRAAAAAAVMKRKAHDIESEMSANVFLMSDFRVFCGRENLIF